MQERRQSVRLTHNIPIKICQEEGDIVTETGNISRSGVYCRVNRYLEPMTKLKVHLLIPIRKRGKDATKKISCQGVVVRTEPVLGSEDYYVAIFFNEIAQKEAQCLSDYIHSYLEGNAGKH